MRADTQVRPYAGEADKDAAEARRQGGPGRRLGRGEHYLWPLAAFGLSASAAPTTSCRGHPRYCIFQGKEGMLGCAWLYLTYNLYIFQYVDQ